jgi:predicted Zn-dependent protease
MLEDVERWFAAVAPDPARGFVSLRLLEQRSERLRMRQGLMLPAEQEDDVGLMATALVDGGIGYAATSDVSERGVAEAIERATRWAERTAASAVIDTRTIAMPHPRGEHVARARDPWDRSSLADRIAILARASERLRASPLVVDWEAELWFTRRHTAYLTNGGGRAVQTADMLVPNLSATAHRDGETQRRSTQHGIGQQGGLEVLERVRFDALAGELGEEAVRLLDAPNCPSGELDLVLTPDQMMLQIHESIGHPLELDRILGDERNYAGTSFVTLDMFGSYRYGSELLDVTFDPTRAGELASYRWDDDGVEAERVHLIERGVLKAPLGSVVSQTRAGRAGTANARATSWNRPAIDRMANLNLEPGESSLAELVAGVERGVLMRTNRSWSIDDSRNKFQFGCEIGQRIEDGQLGALVKNPCYRGISATFWRSLSGVGDASTVEVLGTPFCGKGEPNQIIRVGHASPACRFRAVDVFGGA